MRELLEDYGMAVFYSITGMMFAVFAFNLISRLS
jgi:hypothetical protein